MIAWFSSPALGFANLFACFKDGSSLANPIAMHPVGSREIGNLPFVRFIRGKINSDAVRIFFHHPLGFLSASETSSSSTAGSGAGASAEAAADKVVVAEIRAGEGPRTDQLIRGGSGVFNAHIISVHSAILSGWCQAISQNSKSTLFYMVPTTGLEPV